MNRSIGLISTGILLAGVGCGAKPDPTLPPEAFVSRRPAVGPGSNEPIARSGPLTYDAQHPPVEATPERKPISKVARDVVEAADAPPLASPPTPSSAMGDAMTLPTTLPTGITTAEYQIVGAVIAEVNGKPIFADRVLAHLDRALSAEAKQLDLRRFVTRANALVSAEVSNRINDEVQFVAADKALKKEDHDLARALTVQWRKTQTTLAGGSKVVMYQQSAASGVDFDEETEREYRMLLREIYIDRKMRPLVQVSADDIRRYYQQNIAEYTVAPYAQFRVIKLEYQKNGGRSGAMTKAKDILARAKAGEDFADLAARFNDDPTLMKNKGAVGENGRMPKGAYVVEPVENAVWALHAGDITDPIDTDGAIYLAKVEELQSGRTRPFSDPEVQVAIERKLESEQMVKINERELEKLRRDSVIDEKPGMMQLLLEMIVQKYPQWART